MEKEVTHLNVMVDVGAHIPTRAHEADAGLDLYAVKGKIIWPCFPRTFETGVHVELPRGTWGKIESKSGLNVKHSVVSCGGVIDEGYTGSICVKLYNLGILPYRVRRGDKIAQLVIMPCEKPVLSFVENFAGTERGANGFGSTGR